MTIAELKEAIKDYPDDQFVHMRMWINPNHDYLDYENLQCTVGKIQQGVDGAMLITGTHKTRIE